MRRGNHPYDDVRNLTLLAVLALMASALGPAQAQPPQAGDAEAQERPETPVLPQSTLNVTSTELRQVYRLEDGEQRNTLVIRGSLPRPAGHNIVGYRRWEQLHTIEPQGQDGFALPEPREMDQSPLSSMRNNSGRLYITIEDFRTVPESILVLGGTFDWLVREESLTPSFPYTNSPNSDRAVVSNEWLDLYVDEVHEDGDHADMTLRFDIHRRPPGVMERTAIQRFYQLGLFDDDGNAIARLVNVRDAGSRRGMPRLMYSFTVEEERARFVKVIVPTKFTILTQTFEAQEIPLPQR